MKDLHPNSLTIPYRNLPGFLGSDALAKECAAELAPVRKASKSTLFDRDEVTLWYHRTIANSKKRPAK